MADKKKLIVSASPHIVDTSSTRGLMGNVIIALLPALLTDALGIAIYGMFLAVILPPARSRRSVRLVVVAAAVMSCILRYAPAFSSISGGFSIILCAVSAAALGAWRFPVREAE